MDNEIETLDPLERSQFHNWIDERPEGDLIVRMITQDSFSTVMAVEEMRNLTTAAAVAAASQIIPPFQQDALWVHANYVTSLLVGLARRVPHYQQSKLIDFVVQLQKLAVPDPSGGGLLMSNSEESFWSDMPKFMRKCAMYWQDPDAGGNDDELDQEFLNLTAFVAQLSDIGFCYFGKRLWHLNHLTFMFNEDHKITRHGVRLMCIWFIYAPRKIWLDLQLKREQQTYHHESRATIHRFKPEFWSDWKQFLLDCHSSPLDSLVDKETQWLIHRALDNIKKIEMEESKSIMLG